MDYGISWFNKLKSLIPTESLQRETAPLISLRVSKPACRDQDLKQYEVNFLWCHGDECTTAVLLMWSALSVKGAFTAREKSFFNCVGLQLKSELIVLSEIN